MAGRAAKADQDKPSLKRPPGRPPKVIDWPAALMKFCDLISEDHLSPTAACGALGIDPSRFYAFRDANPWFASAINAARARRLGWFEQMFLKHAQMSSADRGSIGAFVFALKTANGMGEWNEAKEDAQTAAPSVIVQLDLRELARLEANSGIRTVAQIEDVSDALRVEGV